jgi:hypothetical protein
MMAKKKKVLGRGLDALIPETYRAMEEEQRKAVEEKLGLRVKTEKIQKAEKVVMGSGPKEQAGALPKRTGRLIVKPPSGDVLNFEKEEKNLFRREEASNQKRTTEKFRFGNSSSTNGKRIIEMMATAFMIGTTLAFFFTVGSLGLKILF